MPKASNCAALVSLLLCASCMAIAGAAKAPDWVHEAANAPMPNVTALTAAVVLSADDSFTVDEQGHTVRRTRQVIKLLKASARPQWGIYREDFNKDSKVDFLRSWTIAPDGKEYELKEKDVVQRGSYEGHELYSDSSYLEAAAIMADPGAIVAFESQKREFPYMHSELFFLQDRVPVLHHRITLNLPRGWEFNASWGHMEEIKPTQVGVNSWQWDIGETRSLDFDRQPLHPTYYQLAGRMMLSWFGGPVHAEAGNWKNVGMWVDSITAGRPTVTPEISAAAHGLVSGKTGFADQVSAITNFMQDEVRYFAIILGVGGWQPHFAAEIFQHRYGDCKDKVTLLIAMLKSVGISAHYVIVCTERGFISPSVPAVYGNHAIAAIEVPEGYSGPSLPSTVRTKSGRQLVIFDPTDPYLAFGQLPNYLQGGYGVLADGESSELLQLPLLKAGDNSAGLSGHFELASDGTLSGQLVETRSGSSAQERRALYLDGTAKDQRDEQEAFLGRSFSAFTLRNVSVENVRQRSLPLVVKYDIVSKDYGKDAGSMIILRPRIAGTDTEPLDGQQDRRFPVEFASLYSRSEDYVIALPAGYKVEELPDPVEIDSDFATYRSKTEIDNGQLHFARSFRVKAIEIPKEKYPEFRKFELRVAGDENAPAMLVRAN